MRIVDIWPKSKLDNYLFQDVNMFLTHLVQKDAMYRSIAKRAEGYKILDNSIIEVGAAFSLIDVLRAAEEIGADEIILPDAYQDGVATLDMVTTSIEYLKANNLIGKYKLMAVAHGKDEEEWLWCFNALEAIPEIDVIGIPKCLAKMHPAGRPHFEQYWYNTDKTIHLLGLWYGYVELFEYAYPERIRSVDTCMEAYIEKYGTHIRPDGFTINLEED